jgi:4-hydroxythreonine-4-phosphate dehydrogenase
MSPSRSRPIVLTIGDPSGIGPEISLKAWTAQKDELVFFLLGDRHILADLAEPLGIPVQEIDDPAEAATAVRRGLPVLHRAFAAPAVPGAPNPANAVGVVRAIEEAVGLVKAGRAAALCTNPINKKGLRDGAGFGFPGHTEFLAKLDGDKTAVMMLASPELRVVPVTVHVPLREVPGLLTQQLLETTLRITHAALRRQFGVDDPRILVSGLNPHAGEGGAMGSEEAEVIEPVVRRLAAEGMRVTGPAPADTMFHGDARRNYDAAVCMYHDQALIPLKTLDFANGVNVTLGLDFVRTSPDHGTAYDIAGRNLADPSSLIAALRLAHRLSCGGITP